jgi:hypothetical protein
MQSRFIWLRIGNSCENCDRVMSLGVPNKGEIFWLAEHCQILKDNLLHIINVRTTKFLNDQRNIGWCLYQPKSRASVVGIATGYGLDDRGVGVRVPVGSRIFSISSRSSLGSNQPPIQWVPRVKLSERYSDHSTPTSAEG